MNVDPLLFEVVRAVRRAVVPHLGRPDMRSGVGVAVGGDRTFGIDEVAEEAALAVLEEAALRKPLAWYTEDRGLVVRGNAEHIVVLDPIDGTRPAGAGLESACVSIARAPWAEDAVLGDVDQGVVAELRSGTTFVAALGHGAVVYRDGMTLTPALSPQRGVDGSFWCYGLRGRPALASAIVLGEIIDGSGVSGGTFDLGSAAFAMTRLVTGQLDAYVDHGQRIVTDVAGGRGWFETVGGGAVLNNSPYDVAAALLICREAGCVVTDARGEPLEMCALVGSGADFQVSTIAACTPELHAELLAALDRGIARLEEAKHQISVAPSVRPPIG